VKKDRVRKQCSLKDPHQGQREWEKRQNINRGRFNREIRGKIKKKMMKQRKNRIN
jgi:hypothetical protein